MASFLGYGTVKAELTNGEFIICETSLNAEGDYNEWFEPAPVEWMYGWTESDYNVNYDTVEPADPKEFISDTEVPLSVNIKRIIEVIDDIDWEVQDGWNKHEDDEQVA